MFLNIDDYKQLIKGEDLDTVIESDDDTRISAEKTAQEEMTGYLRNRYNTNSVFAAEGEERNPVLIMFMIDLALYHLFSSLPGKMGMETRQIRYEAAIKWLKNVNAGIINPGLPYKDEDDSGNPLSWGSNQKSSSTW